MTAGFQTQLRLRSLPGRRPTSCAASIRRTTIALKGAHMRWESVPDWTDRNGPEKQAFRRLDEALGSDERATIRLRADSSEQAMLTPVSILMSASAAVKVTGPVSEDSKG